MPISMMHTITDEWNILPTCVDITIHVCPCSKKWHFMPRFKYLYHEWHSTDNCVCGVCGVSLCVCRKESVGLDRSLIILVILYDWARLVASTSFYIQQLYIVLAAVIFLEHLRSILFEECCRTSGKYSFHRKLWKVFSFQNMHRQSWLNKFLESRINMCCYCSFSPAHNNLFFQHTEREREGNVQLCVSITPLRWVLMC